MKFKMLALLAATLMISGTSTAVMAAGKTIGVSWSNFQEERWKTDEAAIKTALDAAGDKYISADAQASPTKQLTDVESLISQGRQRAHHPRHGLRGDPAGGQEGERRRHSGRSPMTA